MPEQEQAKEQNKNKISELIQNAKSIAILPSKVAGADAFCAAAALYHMLKVREKQVFIIYPGKLPDGTENLLKPEQITQEVKTRKLVVSIDYAGTQASKVHYSTDKEVLNLMLAPISKDFDPRTKVKAEVVGFEFDLILTLGAQSPYDFGNIFEDVKEDMQKATIINIDNTNLNSRFGGINYIDPLAQSISLMVFSTSNVWGLTPDLVAAKALLGGIVSKEPKGSA